MATTDAPPPSGMLQFAVGDFVRLRTKTRSGLARKYSGLIGRVVIVTFNGPLNKYPYEVRIVSPGPHAGESELFRPDELELFTPLPLLEETGVWP